MERGKLYRVKTNCSLHKTDYGNGNQMAWIEEGSIVLMVTPSDFLSRYSTHFVIYQDLVGWLDVESELLELLHEQG